MDEKEEKRLLRLLESVEKEEIEKERVDLEERERLRIQLFGSIPEEDVEVAEENETIEREVSDESEDNEEYSEHESDSEVSLEEVSVREEINENNAPINDNNEDVNYREQSNEDNRLQNENNNYILGKNNETKWNVHMYVGNLRGRIRQHNIIRVERTGMRLPCPRGEGSNVKTPTEAWKLFFPDNCVDKIVEFTNIWINKNKDNYSRQRDAKATDRAEIHAVIGLLYAAGLMKSSHTNLEDLWATDGFGVDYFGATMSIKRFKFLLRAIRFDDITTRKQRRALDKLAPIRTVFEEFVQRCKDYYSLSAYVTVDEMLEAYRGRCPFRQYMPKKPAKYGIKMFALCDAKTFYTSNLEVYCGVQPAGPNRRSNSVKDVVLRMIAPISGSGRHLTLDNWFSSVPLANELLYNHRITVVCTLKKNKPEIPPCFIDKKIRNECTSLFAYQPDLTLLSYVPKKNKVVLLLSSLHHTDAIDEETGEKQKPVILTCYNKYKGGVDTVDHMKGAYSVSRKTNRWPLTLFFSLLNIASINSFVILRSNVQEEIGNRRQFIKSVVKELCKEQLNKRASMPMIPTRIRYKVRELTGQPVRQVVELAENEPRSGRCFLCGRVKNRKTQTRCSQCHYFICREHTRFSCIECAGEKPEESSEEDDV